MNHISTISFNEIYAAYHRKSFLYARSYVLDDLVAEDIASESLIKLWERLKEEPIEDKYVGPLLFVILKNKALDFLKHEEVKRRAFESMADWQQQEISIRIATLEGSDPDEIFSEEVERIIHETLKSLPEQTQEIFRLSRFENLSNKDIAQQMGLSVKSVEYHISKTLKVLRVALKDYLPLFYFFFYY